MFKVGVASLQWEWHVHSGSGITIVGVASLEWEWHHYSGSGISRVGVACTQNADLSNCCFQDLDGNCNVKCTRKPQYSQ